MNIYPPVTSKRTGTPSLKVSNMKIRSKVTIGLLSSVMCVAALAHAAGYKKAADSGEKIRFATTAMKGTVDIKGHVPHLAVAQSEGEYLILKADLHKMVFNNDDNDNEMGRMDKMRYDHAKKELNFDKFPMAILKVKASDVSVGGKKGSGEFTLHGVTKPVNFTYTAKETGNKVKVDGKFTVKLSQHNIKEICKAEVCVKDTVDVSASFSLEK